MNSQTIQIGDEVVISSWYKSRKPYQNGDLAKVVALNGEISFGPKHAHRIGIEPGIYVDTFWPTLRMKDGMELVWGAKQLKLVDRYEYNKRIQEHRKNKPQQRFRLKRVLPTTVFSEDDEVKILPASSKKVCLNNVVFPRDIFIIQKIYYHLIGQLLDDKPWPIYGISLKNVDSAIFWAGEEDLIPHQH